ncbi:hypothetical protein IQ238_12375 [Pleurocapsales cyanobacterium LEGE 06147]|nr:hypothetical protein [Pleurocapsales cyanobacterium LEGE 06147]
MVLRPIRRFCFTITDGIDSHSRGEEIRSLRSRPLCTAARRRRSEAKAASLSRVGCLDLSRRE